MIGIITFSISLALLILPGRAYTQTAAQVKPVSSTSASTPSGKTTEAKINWITFEEAIERNKKKPKKIFIDVYTDWCGWCKVMDKQTFTDPIIVDYINQNYYAVKFNAEGTQPILFKGKLYEFVPSGNRGYHQLAAELLQGRLSYPTVVFLDEKMDLLQPIPGFRKPPEMDLILKYFGGNHYKTTSYDVFQQQYKSPYPPE
jgi:thioredoxin-related protein